MAIPYPALMLHPPLHSLNAPFPPALRSQPQSTLNSSPHPLPGPSYLPSTPLHLQVGVSLLCCWWRDRLSEQKEGAPAGEENQPEGSESRADTGPTEKLLGESWIWGKQQGLNIINKILMRLFNYVYISLYTRPTNLFSLRKHLMRLMTNHVKQQHTAVCVVSCFVTQPARG